MTQPDQGSARYQMGPRSTRGLIAGWRSGQIACVAVGLVLAVGLLRSIGGIEGALVALVVVGSAAAAATWPIGGRSLEQWVPTVLTFATRAAADGRHRPWRSGRSPARGPLSRLSLFQLEGSSTGVIGDAEAGTWSAVVPVGGAGFALLDDTERASHIAAWSGVLAAMAREGSGLHRIQWVARSYPAYLDGSLLEAFSSVADEGGADEGGQAYARLVGELAPDLWAHEVFVALTVRAGPKWFSPALTRPDRRPGRRSAGEPGRRAERQPGRGPGGRTDLLAGGEPDRGGAARQADFPVRVDDPVPARATGPRHFRQSELLEEELRPMRKRGRRRDATSGSNGEEAMSFTRREDRRARRLERAGAGGLERAGAPCSDDTWPTDSRRSHQTRHDPAPLLRRQLAALSERLQGAGLLAGPPLSPSQLAGNLRRSFEASPLNDVVIWPWPVGVAESWSMLRTDATWQAVYWIAEWPRSEVGTTFMLPLLLAGGIRQCTSVTMAPLPPLTAVRRAERERTSGTADAELRQRHGFAVSARARREQESRLQRESELAGGHAGYRYSGYVTVTGRDVDDLEESCARIEQAAALAQLELRRLYGAQEEAFCCSLPIGRGCR